MKISVIIPTFNGKNKIRNLLTSLEKQVFKDFEVIVVIDGSTDRTYDYLKSREWKLLNLYFFQTENKGRAGARNSGARVAKGDLLVFLDDDIILGENSLDFYYHHYNKNFPAIIVGCLLESSSSKDTDVQRYKSYLTTKWQNSIAQTFAPVNKPYLTAANCSIPKSIFLSLEGFDEQLRDCEDYDLAIRAQKKLIPIYFDPTIKGWHDDFVTAKKYVNRLKEYEIAFQKLCHLKNMDHGRSSVSILKKLIYWFLSFSFWLKLIDAQAFFWLPKRGRFSLYNAIFFSQSRVFPR